MDIGRSTASPVVTVLTGQTEGPAISIATMAIGFVRGSAAIALTFVGEAAIPTKDEADQNFTVINDEAGAPVTVTMIADQWVPLPAELMGFAGLVKPVIGAQGSDTVLEFALKG